MRFLYSEQIRMAAGVNKLKNQNIVENPVNQKHPILNPREKGALFFLLHIL